MRKICYLLLLIGLCLTVGKIWYWRTDGFNISRLQGRTQELQGVWWDDEAEAAILQDFHYVARGRQAFVFASVDGLYVIKFPRGDTCKLPFWLRSLPLESRRKRQITRKAYRENFVLQSARLAMEELKESTAMIAMNLSLQGPAFLKAKTIRIIDKVGRSYQIPLGSAYFFLQRKKKLFSEVIQEAELKEGMEGVKKVMDALFAVIVERTEKGILNRDKAFLQNYGFDEKRGYQTDVGDFFQAGPGFTKDSYFQSIESSVKPIRCWMQEKHPEWLDLLVQKSSRE
jgi:hypothetical protein